MKIKDLIIDLQDAQSEDGYEDIVFDVFNGKEFIVVKEHDGKIDSFTDNPKECSITLDAR